MNVEKFVRIATDLDWTRTEDVYRACVDAGNVFEAADEEASRELHYKALIRRAFAALKDANGNRIFASVKTTDEEGNSVSFYKQERMFEVDDLRYVADYHFKIARHHYEEGRRYATRAKDEFGVQLPIPEFWARGEAA